jgi:hypothetical protein
MTQCDRREAWPQAMWERRSGLDLATEESLTPAMRGGDRGRGERTREARFAGSNPHSGFNGVARHRARYGRRRPGVVAVRPLPGGSHTLLVAAVKHSGRRKTVRVASELFGRSRRARAVAMTWDVRGRFCIRARLLQPQARGVGEIETIQPSAGNRARGSTKHRNESAEAGASEQQHPLFPPSERELVGVSRRPRHDTQMPGVCSKHHTAGGE